MQQKYKLFHMMHFPMQGFAFFIIHLYTEQVLAMKINLF